MANPPHQDSAANLCSPVKTEEPTQPPLKKLKIEPAEIPPPPPPPIPARSPAQEPFQVSQVNLSQFQNRVFIPGVPLTPPFSKQRKHQTLMQRRMRKESSSDGTPPSRQDPMAKSRSRRRKICELNVEEAHERREKNRLAAKKCRKRTKEKIGMMVLENQGLRARIDGMENQHNARLLHWRHRGSQLATLVDSLKSDLYNLRRAAGLLPIPAVLFSPPTRTSPIKSEFKKIITSPKPSAWQPEDLKSEKNTDTSAKQAQDQAKPVEAQAAKPAEAQVNLAEVQVNAAEAQAKPAEAQVKTADVQVNPVDAEVKPAEVQAKPVEVQVKPVDAQMKPAEAPVKPPETQTKTREAQVGLHLSQPKSAFSSVMPSSASQLETHQSVVKPKPRKFQTVKLEPIKPQAAKLGPFVFPVKPEPSRNLGNLPSSNRSTSPSLSTSWLESFLKLRGKQNRQCSSQSAGKGVVAESAALSCSETLSAMSKLENSS